MKTIEHACATCGRADAHAEARKTSTTRLPYEHCYHSVGLDGFKCCWCGDVLPQTITLTSSAAQFAHGLYATPWIMPPRWTE